MPKPNVTSTSPSHFDLMSKVERQEKINELQILDQELSSLKKQAKVYQRHGNSSLFFVADKATVLSETRLSIKNLTDAHNNKLK